MFRTFLPRRAALSALALATAAIAAPGTVMAQAKEIRIAHIHSKTGPLEAYAKQTHAGLMLGLEYATGGTMTVLGRKIVVIERDSQFSGGTVYCTLLYFGPDGRLMGKHRKLKPTAGERLIWGEGDGSTMPVFNTEIGKIGGLICWENYMPLARMAMYSKGVEIYLAPTADARDSWHPTLRYIALEGRCFVLGCNQFVTKDIYPADLSMVEELASQCLLIQAHVNHNITYPELPGCCRAVEAGGEQNTADLQSQPVAQIQLRSLSEKGRPSGGSFI